MAWSRSFRCDDMPGSCWRRITAPSWARRGGSDSFAGGEGDPRQARTCVNPGIIERSDEGRVSDSLAGRGGALNPGDRAAHGDIRPPQMCFHSKPSTVHKNTYTCSAVSSLKSSLYLQSAVLIPHRGPSSGDGSQAQYRESACLFHQQQIRRLLRT